MKSKDLVSEALWILLKVFYSGALKCTKRTQYLMFWSSALVEEKIYETGEKENG